MTGALGVRNRQRTCKIDLPRLRRIARCLLQEHFHVEKFELSLHLVGAAEMTRLNEKFLRHAGSTDVIAFDYGSSPSLHPMGRGKGEGSVLAGEIFICLDEAQAQAGRYHTTWPSELVRYLIHGLLHLRGYDDRKPAARRKMKREEDKLLREVLKRFPLKLIAKA